MLSRRGFFGAAAGALAAGAAVGQQVVSTRTKRERINFRPTPEPTTLDHTPAQAVGWAFDALLKYPVEDQPYIRFCYLPPWADAEWVGAMDFAVNAACSHTRTLHRADRHAGGWLLGYNLLRYATGTKLTKLVSVWDSLALVDPHFHLQAFNAEAIVCTLCKGGGQLQWKGRFRACERCGGKGKLFGEGNTAFLAPHLSQALARHVTKRDVGVRLDVLVAQLTNSTGGIYRADFLLEQLLTSARGKYPEFRQIEFAVTKGTPFSEHLRKRGFSVKQSFDFRGEQGALLLCSDVTGKSRIVICVSGLGGQGPLFVTFDFNDTRIRPDEQFIRNLIEFDALDDAGEAFLPLENGLIEYLLVDGKGNFQRVAPPNVVADDTKPRGHTKELEMGMSCVLCHGPNGGYNTRSNDLDLFIGSDTDFIGNDLSYTDAKGRAQHLTPEQAVDLVVGRYGDPIYDPDGVLERARRDYAESIGRLTDYSVAYGQPNSVVRLASKVQDIYHGYRYRKVDARQACLEIAGVRCDRSRALGILRQLAPVVANEDPLAGLMRNGAELKRDDFDPLVVELSRRAMVNLPRIFN